jgi:hypothetical protein
MDTITTITERLGRVINTRLVFRTSRGSNPAGDSLSESFPAFLLHLPGFYSPIQANTALTMPLHRILSDDISKFGPSGWHRFRFLKQCLFYGMGLLVPLPTPNLEDQDSVFITPRDRGAQFDRLLRPV